MSMKKYKLYLWLFFVLNYVYAESQINSLDQLFLTRTKNLIPAFNKTGISISEKDRLALQKGVSEKNANAVVSVLDRYTLLKIDINNDEKISVKQSIIKPVLQQNGWTAFLIKVNNNVGITKRLEIASEEAKSVYDGGEKIYGMGGDAKGSVVSNQDIKNRWLDFNFFTEHPVTDTLSGSKVEYFIIQLYSRDSGRRRATFDFSLGDSAKENKSNILFNCLAAHTIKLSILDFDHTPTAASLLIKDAYGHILPSYTKRLAPDLFFESQIYRYNGDTIYLPSGNYSVEYNRGAEYVKGSKNFEVTNKANQSLGINLIRWINPNKMGYYSGDSHIHASGCSYYTSPTQGVKPDDLIYHVVGEGVNVACILIWGRGYEYQKQFFEGKDNKLSTKNNLLHYDMEISVFPSGHAGHLVLLGLKDQNYPNTKEIDNWPTYTIPILKWAKAQGAITGYAHSGLGLEVQTDSLPNYALPKFDGIGANEYIVSVTQNIVDFISALDTPPIWELNIWYHTLNCDFRTRMVGETDYPCLSDDKIAHGRTYVKLDKELNYSDWIEGLKSGRSYVSEGKSHLMDFTINDVEIGTQNSEVNLTHGSTVKVSAKVSALLNEKEDSTIKPLDYHKEIWSQKPFWDLEKARIKNSRTVPVELIVNGEVVERKIIMADGKIRDISFETMITKSSWVAIRILPSSHTNPIFVLVNHEPTRASKKSAEWCLNAVDICWAQKQLQIAKESREEAKKLYDLARRLTYKRIIAECIN